MTTKGVWITDKDGNRKPGMRKDAEPAPKPKPKPKE